MKCLLLYVQWLQLKSRRQNLMRLLENMQHFQFDTTDPDKPLESHVRTLTDLDIERYTSDLHFHL